ncbi:hypothetical protein [Microbacterium oleivorans]|uniref:DUF3558 domain-containing protein n=1 Tax=Microbacterium oleivorans TaxID=273677 RepID=A0A7D5JFU6_9MICO|nr:hypothetical protein [Microbacterium oleivorans]QLD12178.1 hypothetical protein HW566_10595 [Microbacterium oleivorans]
MTAPALRRLAPAALVVAVALLAGCAPEPEPAPSAPAPSVSPTAPGSPAPIETRSPQAGGPPPPATGAVATTTVLPRDCDGILGPTARSALAGVPLNDPAFGETGVLDGGALRCVWADPGADTAKIETTIVHAAENPVIDFLNELSGIGFTCYEPDAGVRCEKTWQNERYPVTDGRTLYFRDGVLIDTQFSHLAPAGFTSGVIASLWPAGGAATPTP